MTEKNPYKISLILILTRYISLGLITFWAKICLISREKNIEKKKWEKKHWKKNIKGNIVRKQWEKKHRKYIEQNIEETSKKQWEKYWRKHRKNIEKKKLLTNKKHKCYSQMGHSVLNAAGQKTPGSLKRRLLSEKKIKKSL